MSAVLVLIALLLVFASGFGLAMLIPGKGRTYSIPELACLSWLLGTAFVTLASLLAGLLLGGALQVTVTLGCIALAWVGIKRMKGRIEPLRSPQGWVERFLLAVIAAQLGILCWLATRQFFGWDGVMIWEFKARTAFLNGGLPPAEYFSSSTCQWSHQSYPLFLPLLENWIYTWIDACDQSWVRAIFPIFYAAGVTMLGMGVAKLSGKTWAGLLAATIPFFLPFILARDGGVLGGYADFPLGVFYLAGVIHLLLFLRSRSMSDLRICAAMSAVLPWIKSEGAILWLCLSLIGALACFQQIRARALLLALPGFVTIEIWSLFAKYMRVAPNRDFLPVRPSTLFANLGRGIPVLHEAVLEFGDLSHWSLLWFGIAAALIGVLACNRSRSFLVLASAIVAPLCLFTSVYFFSNAASYMTHFLTSFPRLTLQIAPTGILMVALVLDDLLRKLWCTGQEVPSRLRASELPVIR